ncbi:MAG TPA: MMPL family transporter [Candidatus Limnocylindrales bacterium]|nr:MMPL family transporter [Candidatus Limnocylindrales bacterium]
MPANEAPRPARRDADDAAGPGGGPAGGVFGALGRVAVRRRWAIVAMWAAVLAIAIPLAPRVVGVLRAGGFILDDLESARAKTLLQTELGTPPSAVVIVLHSDTAEAGTAAFEAPAAQAIAAVPSAPGVVRVVSHVLSPRQVSADRHTAYDIVFLSIPPDDSPAALPGIRAALAAPSGLDVELAGGPAFYGDVQAVSESDLRRSEIVSLPLAAIALLIVFGSVVAAAVPLIVGGSAVIVALAAIWGAASLTPMSIFVLNLATLLGLGLGVDYSLLMTSRFREELAAHAAEPPDERVAHAVEATVATAGRAVFFSGLTVLLGLAGLVLFEFMILRSVGIAGAIVVLLAGSAALTLLPAVLAIVGPRIDRLAIRRVVPRDDPNGPWARLARRVMAHPVAVLAPTLLTLIVLGSPFLHVRFNAPDSTILPPSVPSRAAFDRLASAFGEGEFAPIVLAIRTPGPATSPDNVAALYDYSRRLAADPRIRRIDSFVDVDPRLRREQYQLLYADPNGPRDRFVATALAATTRGDLTAFTITTPFGPNQDQGRALVTDLRAGSGPLAPPAGMTVLVGGGAADVSDVVGRVAQDFPRTALFIVIATYAVLFLLLRSVVLPAKALVMNTLSIVASFGALVWIFQDGNLSALLGFQPLGFVETTQPVILFCVLFGLSMDYEVFLLTRMKEQWDRTGDNQEAVARGLERSGRIVTSAALIVVVVAGSFAFADIVLIKALGLGMALAVALDATVVRALLVPATMRLLGHWNWWLPAGLRRVPSIETAGIAGLLALALVAGPLLAGCSAAGTPVLANPPAPHPTPAPQTPAPSSPVDPRPVELPRDDAPHDRLTEWWYYTGHLRSADGHRFGFEFVIFRAERGAFPVTWASHLALTDETAGTFRFAQRAEIGPQADASGAGAFVLSIAPGPADTAGGAGGSSTVPWTMAGGDGRDHLAASAVADPASPTAGALGLDLTLRTRKPAALHDRIGWIDFAAGGSSYYYSRTSMAATGTVVVDGTEMAVTGDAWFDHQWGDFIAVGGGGWDWFALNLDDGTDLTLSLVRDADGSYPLVYGTLVTADGTTRHLPRDAFQVAVTRRWTSAATGADYPAGWRVTIPGEGLVIDLTPAVADQELDTRATTGVVYWEGSQRVAAQRDGNPLGGQAYVELTGYAPAGVAGPPARASAPAIVGPGPGG